MSIPRLAVKGGGPKGHDDADYDRVVLGRLNAVHRRSLPLAAAAAQLPRLDTYAVKLQAAVGLTREGETKAGHAG
ncbi:hypothetical protein [Mycolicibacterium duvalii]|uniref:Uncharacterized protein n=1 Tax=Mycolicibacterium duvalii TaxID=39688 RepID=A0A7I7JYU9_9MYCO|nr:hypothetical protein [Mycolicibacterium duvalii]MCV7370818.1 hypothetical protein [Mycolicibacterium duvalii]BBX17066.1 hypothetical protein MDUV_19260 [Mycolicibacterium duvalii]